MRNILTLIKINLLWLFKYRCNIPDGVWFAEEHISEGLMVYVSNKRLHLLRVCKASEIEHNPYGIALTDGGLGVLKKGHFDMVHNFNPGYYDVWVDDEMRGYDGQETTEETQ